MAVLALGACTSFPTGPSMLALPGNGRSFDQFRFDEADCRQYASGQVEGKTANDFAADSGVKSAVVGTVIGAAAGALLGGHNGAGVGAGTGLLIGSIAGAGAAEGSGRNLQQRYDFSYQQCMYAKGHRVPISGRMNHPQRLAARNGNYVSSPSAGPYVPPPPPPGWTPPTSSSSSNLYTPLNSGSIQVPTPPPGATPLTTPAPSE